jgi:DmsE family decaheme c-type cytochrome
MKKLIHMLVFGATALGFAALAATPATASDGSEDCAMCHDEIVAEFEMTVHSPNRADSPSCVTCHGDGAEHMDNDGDPTLIEMPRGAALDTMCQQCHGSINTMFSSRSVHADSGVHCDSCHSVHAPAAAQPMQLVRSANSLCADCHPSQDGSFNKPFGHDLDRGGIQCISCHNPHGGQGEQSLVLDHSGQTACVTCHAEKRGPFVYPHVTDVSGTCMSCHEPHGSTNPMALKRARVDQLCLECHSVFDGSTLGSQTPSFHDLRSPRYQNCTTCHVTVHGSNASPLLLK